MCLCLVLCNENICEIMFLIEFMKFCGVELKGFCSKSDIEFCKKDKRVYFVDFVGFFFVFVVYLLLFELK